MFLSNVKDKYKYNLVSVVLFGSIARGKGTRESDIDLLIILEEAPDVYYKCLKPFVDIELKIREDQVYEKYIKERIIPCFSYLIFSVKEANENHHVFLDMIEDSIILYDKNDYFKKRLSFLRERLSCLGSKKLSLDDGTWYWDLKPDLKVGEEFVL
jgi:predicted nucleotidyltransferase